MKYTIRNWHITRDKNNVLHIGNGSRQSNIVIYNDGSFATDFLTIPKDVHKMIENIISFAHPEIWFKQECPQCMLDIPVYEVL